MLHFYFLQLKLAIVSSYFNGTEMKTKFVAGNTSITIVSESPLLRSALRRVVSENNPDLVLTEFSDPGELLSRLSKSDIEIIILCYQTSAGLGLDLLQQIKSVHPDQAVIVINLFPADHEALSILRAQADAYLGSSAGENQLFEALTRVDRGKRFISPRVAEKLVYQLSSGLELDDEPQLSSRETQVLSLIAQGKKRADIADILCLSPQTISSYRSRILEKLGLANTAELIRYAVENQLV